MCYTLNNTKTDTNKRHSVKLFLLQYCIPLIQHRVADVVRVFMYGNCYENSSCLRVTMKRTYFVHDEGRWSFPRIMRPVDGFLCNYSLLFPTVIVSVAVQDCRNPTLSKMDIKQPFAFSHVRAHFRMCSFPHEF